MDVAHLEIDDPEWREIAAMPTWRDGFPSRAEAIERYAVRTGCDVGAIGWHAKLECVLLLSCAKNMW